MRRTLAGLRGCVLVWRADGVLTCLAPVLPLFIFPGVTEIDIPDCSNIDESSFLRTLKECLEHGLSLTTLRLGLCGRCIADDAILDLGYARESVYLRVRPQMPTDLSSH